MGRYECPHESSTVIEAKGLSLSLFYMYVCNMYTFIYSIHHMYIYVWVDTIVPTNRRLLLRLEVSLSLHYTCKCVYIYTFVYYIYICICAGISDYLGSLLLLSQRCRTPQFADLLSLPHSLSLARPLSHSLARVRALSPAARAKELTLSFFFSLSLLASLQTNGSSNGCTCWQLCWISRWSTYMNTHSYMNEMYEWHILVLIRSYTQVGRSGIGCAYTYDYSFLHEWHL